MIRLNIEKSFSDKNTNKKHMIGDVIEVDDARGEELLADSRKLVSLNERINEVDIEPKKAKRKSK